MIGNFHVQFFRALNPATSSALLRWGLHHAYPAVTLWLFNEHSGQEQKDATLKYDEALLIYAKASHACPALFQCYYNAGLCCVQLGRDREALAQFEMAAAKNGTFRLTFWHLADLYEKTGNKAAAASSRATLSML